MYTIDKSGEEGGRGGSNNRSIGQTQTPVCLAKKRS